ncbi:MAG: SCO family protein [Sulfuricellaceae bacterium]
MLKKWILVGAIALFATLLVWVVFFWQPDSAKPAAAPRSGDFTLRSAAGQLSLHDLRGKVVLLYFGYTLCPDICPTSLAFTAQGLAQLDAKELEKVKMLFVTVDPERDTLERLKDYTAYFHPSIVGLTGAPEEIARAAKLYGASYARQQVASAAGYVIDHSADTYLIAPDGSLYATLPHATPPGSVAEKIRAALKLH